MYLDHISQSCHHQNVANIRILTAPHSDQTLKLTVYNKEPKSFELYHGKGGNIFCFHFNITIS